MIQRGGIIKAFDSSGVKARFRHNADSKAFTRYGFFMTKSIEGQKKIAYASKSSHMHKRFFKELTCQFRFLIGLYR